ncbi:hypothetical protein GCM10009591_23800 [Brachybacterium tyrofermentans]
MDPLGRGVAGIAAVNHDDRATGADQHERAVEAGGATADHDDIEDASEGIVRSIAMGIVAGIAAGIGLGHGIRSEL